MQITGSNFAFLSQSVKASNVTHTSASKPETDFAKLADYDSRENIIFQNLLKNPTVQDNVVLNEDGTYSFVPGQGALSEEEGVMRALIEEQNGDFRQTGGQAPYSVEELMMFRQTTGYNLLQAGGGYMVVDDYGRPVSADDRAMVEAAWQLFDTAKGIQGMADPGGSLSVDGLKAVGEMLRERIDADSELYQNLIDMLSALGKELANRAEVDDALLGEA